VLVHDVNQARENRLRHQALLFRAAAEAARGEKEQALFEEEEAIEDAALLDKRTVVNLNKPKCFRIQHVLMPFPKT
jgi:hypothetical protein